VKEPKWVYKWRLEAERKAGGGLSDTEVQDFVDRFMPAYDAYLPALYENPPPESLIVVVDEYRDVLMVHVTDAGPLRGVPQT
jgi:D-glycerate 3-kinase